MLLEFPSQCLPFHGSALFFYVFFLNVGGPNDFGIRNCHSGWGGVGRSYYPQGPEF